MEDKDVRYINVRISPWGFRSEDCEVRIKVETEKDCYEISKIYERHFFYSIFERMISDILLSIKDVITKEKSKDTHD